MTRQPDQARRGGGIERLGRADGDPDDMEAVTAERNRVSDVQAECLGQPLLEHRAAGAHPVPGGEIWLVDGRRAAIAPFGVDRDVDPSRGEAREGDRERSGGRGHSLGMKQRGELVGRRVSAAPGPGPFSATKSGPFVAAWVRANGLWLAWCSVSASVSVVVVVTTITISSSDWTQRRLMSPTTSRHTSRVRPIAITPRAR